MSNLPIGSLGSLGSLDKIRLRARVTGFVSRKRHGHMWLTPQKELWHVSSLAGAHWFHTRKAAYKSLAGTRRIYADIVEEIKPYSAAKHFGKRAAEGD